MQDASDVMQLLLKTQTDFNDLEDDDPQVCQSITFTFESTLLLEYLMPVVRTVAV